VLLAVRIAVWVYGEVKQGYDESLMLHTFLC